MARCSISERYRFIYVHVANCATTALRAEFAKPEYQSFECEYTDADLDRTAEYLRFTVLQDPVARVLSAYRDISRLRALGELEAALPFFNIADPVARFLGFVQETEKHPFDPLVELQSSQLEGVAVDRYCSSEFPGDDLADLFDALGISAHPRLPELANPQRDRELDDGAKHLVCEDDLTAEAREKIRRIFSVDFELYQDKMVRARARSARLLASFQKRQKEPRHTFAYRLGSRGFYAELSTVARAILYCLAFDMRLVIDSSAFAYRRERGWNDYFLPFCPDLAEAPDIKVDLDCHSDIRGPGTVFNSLIRHRVQSIKLGDVTIRGFDQILGTLLLMIFRFNDQTSREVARIEQECALPSRYASMHVRRGDKVGDEDLYYPVEVYLDRLEKLGGTELPLFVMTDDHKAVLETEAELQRRRSSAPVYSLTDDPDQGFSAAALRRQLFAAAPGDISTDAGNVGVREQIGLETNRLLAETVIASRSECFVGTFLSNVSRSIWYLHDRPGRCALLSPDALQNVASERV